MILVVEDIDQHFQGLHDYLVQLCRTLKREHEIERAQSTDEVKKWIERCQRQAIPLILIFDMLMEVPGGPHTLTRYIRKLWAKPNDEWLATVPIVVWSVHVDRLQDLDEHPRTRSSIVSKLGTTGMDDLEELDAALQAALL